METQAGTQNLFDYVNFGFGSRISVKVHIDFQRGSRVFICVYNDSAVLSWACIFS